jgi:hypothetical protein
MLRRVASPAIASGLALPPRVADGTVILKGTYVSTPAASGVPQAAASPAIDAVGGLNTVYIQTAFNGAYFGYSGDRFTPPDPQLAVGTTYVVEMVNTLANIYSKSGTFIRTIDLRTLFIAGADDLTDPRVVFDPSSGQFFASISDITTNEVNVAVTSAGDPTGTWNVYAFTSGTSTSYFADQPSLGVSSDKVVVAANMFDPASNFVGVEIFVLNRSQMMAGLDVNFTDFSPDDTLFSVYPVTNQGDTADEYLVSVDPTVSGSFTLFKVSGAWPGNITLDNVTVSISASSPPNGATQKGSSSIIDSGDGRVVSAIWYQGKVWFSFPDSAIPTGDTQHQDGFRLVEVNTANDAVLQDFDVNAARTSYFYPAMAIDGKGDFIVLFGFSSLTAYPGLMISAQSPTDPANSLQTPAVVINGTAAETSGRYGDYFGAAVDPSNPQLVWGVGQYGTARGWATYVFSSSVIANVVTLSASYSVVGGGTGYSPPTLSYSLNNLTKSVQLTTTPQSFPVDNGTSWSVDAQLGGSSSAERWVALQPTAGTIKSSPVVSITYRHQFNISFTASVAGQAGSGSPTVAFVMAGAPSNLTLVQGISLAGPAVYSASSWVDAGSQYSFINPLPGSNGTYRWISAAASGNISSGASVSVGFVPQASYQVSLTPANGPSSLQGTLTIVQYGSALALPVTTTPAAAWLDVGSQWAFSGATVTVGTGTRYVYSGPTAGTAGSPSALVFAFGTQYYLTVGSTPQGEGSVSPASSWYDAGTAVNLTATSAAGWGAGQWTGTGTGSYSGSAPSASFSLSGPTSESMSFYPGVTVAAGSGGSVTYGYGTTQGTVAAGTTKTFYLPGNSTVTLTAQPDSFLNVFGGWSGASASSASQVVIVASTPAAITANFTTNFAIVGGVAILVIAVVAALFLVLRRKPSAHQQAPP